MFLIRLLIFVGDEAANSNDSNWSMDCSTVVRVKTLHISSPILAAKSPFFYKVELYFCKVFYICLPVIVVRWSFNFLLIYCSYSQMG